MDWYSDYTVCSEVAVYLYKVLAITHFTGIALQLLFNNWIQW
jgi:hypothetical protein